jgi:hypothetical protein
VFNITEHEVKNERMIRNVKVNVKLSLCLTKHYAMKTYWGIEVQHHTFLTSALEGREWSASLPDFIPRETAPRYPLVGSRKKHKFSDWQKEGRL